VSTSLPVVVSLSFLRFYGEGYLDNLSLVFVNAVAEFGEIPKPLTRLCHVTRVNSTRKESVFSR
jgi:hypothetical protein